MSDIEQRFYSISDVAKRCGISTSMVAIMGKACGNAP
jgi:hypothetical protein